MTYCKVMVVYMCDMMCTGYHSSYKTISVLLISTCLLHYSNKIVVPFTVSGLNFFISY